MTGLRKAWASAVQTTKAGFTSLRGSPRDLYLIFALKVLESYQFFSLSRSMVLYFTEEFGIDDYRAGTLYGLWGTLLTGYGFLLGGAIDYLGVKASLIISFLLNMASRLVMACTTNTWLLMVMLFGPNTIAGALGVPVMTIGVKRYTNEVNRGFAFSLFYSLMNAAALVQGLLMDVFRIGLRHGFNLPGWGEHSLPNSGFRMFLASGCVTALAGLCLATLLSNGPCPTGAAPATKRKASEVLQAGEEGEQRRAPSPEQPLMLDAHSGSSSSASAPEPGQLLPPRRVLSAEERLLEKGGASAAAGAGAEGLGSAVVSRRAVNGSGAGAASGNEGQDSGETPSKAKPHAPAGTLAATLESIKAVLGSRGFWKYMCMCVFTVNLKSIFRHLDATLPKFQLRAFGCDTPIGLIYAINPAMIVLLVPVVGAMTTEFAPFDMIHLGGYISALSPFWMVLFDTEWSTAVFVAMLSLGEAIWSPRWYDYSMSVAPEGREGIFTALASAPLFAAMLPTGMISGALLAAYCPDNGQCVDGTDSPPGRRLLAAAVAAGQAGAVHARGLGDEPPVVECDGRVLWLIVGAITVSSPLLILLTQRWIRPSAQDFAKVSLLPTHSHRTEIEGEHMDVNEADPAALVENVYQARSESREAEWGPAGEVEQQVEERPLLTIHQPHPRQARGGGGAARRE